MSQDQTVFPFGPGFIREESQMLKMMQKTHWTHALML
jgi:hypothetical protein